MAVWCLRRYKSIELLTPLILTNDKAKKTTMKLTSVILSITILYSTSVFSANKVKASSKNIQTKLCSESVQSKSISQTNSIKRIKNNYPQAVYNSAPTIIFYSPKEGLRYNLIVQEDLEKYKSAMNIVNEEDAIQRKNLGNCYDGSIFSKELAALVGKIEVEGQPAKDFSNEVNEYSDENIKVTLNSITRTNRISSTLNFTVKVINETHLVQFHTHNTWVSESSNRPMAGSYPTGFAVIDNFENKYKINSISPEFDNSSNTNKWAGESVEFVMITNSILPKTNLIDLYVDKGTLGNVSPFRLRMHVDTLQKE